jgi:hypothetical protein
METHTASILKREETFFYQILVLTYQLPCGVNPGCRNTHLLASLLLTDPELGVAVLSAFCWSNRWNCDWDGDEAVEQGGGVATDVTSGEEKLTVLVVPRQFPLVLLETSYSLLMWRCSGDGIMPVSLCDENCVVWLCDRTCLFWLYDGNRTVEY